MVVASFQSQYGLRLSRDLSGMKWREFSYYIAGLDSESPLGRIINIRAEDDPEILKEFSPAQRRIRNEWRTKKAKQMPKEQAEATLYAIRDALISISDTKPKEAAHEEDTM